MTMSRRAVLLGAAAMATPAVQAQKSNSQLELNSQSKRDMMRATERHLTFTSGGKTIKVDAFGPEDVRRPAVIMLHGADGLGANRQYVDGARDMAQAGYHVYLIHYLDRTQERRASFSTLFQNFQPWMETVQDSVAWVSGRPETDAGSIGVIGISLGAALGLAVASADRRIGALVDYFGPLPQGAIAADAHLPPTLVLHGMADPIVPVANAYAIEALLKQKDTPYEIKVYPGQGHGFHGAAQADATQRVVTFLRQHLPA